VIRRTEPIKFSIAFVVENLRRQSRVAVATFRSITNCGSSLVARDERGISFVAPRIESYLKPNVGQRSGATSQRGVRLRQPSVRRSSLQKQTSLPTKASVDLESELTEMFSEMFSGRGWRLIRVRNSVRLRSSAGLTQR
jgi:hypothetical protein